jgi:FkbM family methyltransferase
MHNNTPEVMATFDQLARYPELHRVDSEFFCLLQGHVREIVASSFDETQSSHRIDMGELGSVKIVGVNLGNVSSLDVLSSLNEWVILSYYLKNRFRYRAALDVGANIGIHGIFMKRCGWSVTCFEPDPRHISLLKRNLELNNLVSLNVIEAAISNRSGRSVFRRVIGNTTGSHLVGAKPNVYGPVDDFEVQVISISDYLQEVDIIKLDVEGHEASIICAIPEHRFLHLDLFSEVGSRVNADRIFNYCRSLGLNIFSQKLGWGVAAHPSDIPSHYSEGSIFISAKKQMAWD